MKKYITILLSLLIIAGVVFLSCNKEVIINNDENNNLFILKSGNDSLMNDSVVQLMLAELDDYNIQIKNNILQFETAIDFNAIINILHKYDSLVQEKNDYPRYPALYAFEQHYGFSSLRSEIEEDVCRIEDNEGLTEINDPDNFYVANPFFRTLLTPTCDIIVHDTIYIILDGYSLSIIDYDFVALEETHNYVETFGATRGGAFANLLGSVQYVIKSACFAEFSFNFDSSNANKVYFDNASYGDLLTYSWNFGDGSYISTETNPIHTYTASGTYVVILEVFTPSGIADDEGNILPPVFCNFIEKSINVGSCTANFTFIESEDMNGRYHFTNTSYSILGTITGYNWSFGDGSTSTDENPVHDFINGSQSVTLTVSTSLTPACTDSYNRTFTVFNSETCCKWWEREKLKYVYYDNNERRIKLVFSMRNLPFWHMIYAKTTNYKKKSSGNGYRLNRADEMITGIGGKIWNWDCDTYITFGPIEDSESNSYWTDAHIYLFSTWVKLRKNSAVSSYYVKDNNCIINDVGLHLHDDDCD